MISNHSFVLTSLVCCLLAVLCNAVRLDTTYKPNYIKVNATNQHLFGVPLGTLLQRDKYINRYRPPHLSLSLEEVKYVQPGWFNAQTSESYCLSPLQQIPEARGFVGYDWYPKCVDEKGFSLCCNQARCACDDSNTRCDCFVEDNYEEDEAEMRQDYWAFRRYLTFHPDWQGLD